MTAQSSPSRQPDGRLGLGAEAGAALRARARRLGLRRLRRDHVAAARMLVERRALALAPRRPHQRDRILCYHAVGTPAWGVNDLAPARFRRQLEMAKARGYRVVPAEELAEELVQPAGGGGTGPRAGAQAAAAGPRLAVTFDDAVSSVLTHAVPVLRDLEVPWTMFVVAEWAEGHHLMAPGSVLGWDDIAALAAGGATIGSHSLSHADFATLTPEEAEHELSGSRMLIRERTGIDPIDFAIPFGQSSNWINGDTAAAHRAGYRWLYAQSEQRRPVGTVARTFVSRFDGERLFAALLDGAFDRWEEWV